MLKRTAAIIIAGLLICSMAACSASQNSSDAETVKVQESFSVKNSDELRAEDVFGQSSNEASSETNAVSGTDDNSVSEGTEAAEESGSSSESDSGSEVSRSSKKTQNKQAETTPSEASTSNGFIPDGSSSSGKSVQNNVSPSEPDASASRGSSSDTAEPGTSSNNEAFSGSGRSSGGQSVTGNGSAEVIDTSDLFSSRDLAQTADLTDAKTVTAENNGTVTITEAGVYIISGSASDFTIKIEADNESKVQLVLDGVSVTNSDFPVIYVVSADKVFVTTTDTENTLSVTGAFTSDGDTNTDAVIFSKDDLVLNGTGTLTINSSCNGISGKDDIKITGGAYNITSAEDSIEANDSISVYDGTFSITSSKDGLHSENDDDDTVGWIYIGGGSFNIRASSDSIQAATYVQIDGGNFDLTSAEGIEGTNIVINDGTISITASDDGINAARKSSSVGTPSIIFNGGSTTIVMGQGDTDAVDVNGNIIVNGGTINITARMSSFDYDGTAQYNGGTIIINGSQVNSIPQSMMGGGGRGGMGGMRGGW